METAKHQNLRQNSIKNFTIYIDVNTYNILAVPIGLNFCIDQTGSISHDHWLSSGERGICRRGEGVKTEPKHHLRMRLATNIESINMNFCTYYCWPEISYVSFNFHSICNQLISSKCFPVHCQVTYLKCLLSIHFTCKAQLHVYVCCGRHSGLMASVLDSRLRDSVSFPGQDTVLCSWARHFSFKCISLLRLIRRCQQI